MDRERVDGLLSDYRSNLGRTAHLKNAIEELNTDIEKAIRCMVSEAALAGGGYDDMPRGTDISRRVENLGIKFADGYIPAEIKEMQDEVERMEEEYNTKLKLVAYVDAWLTGLNDRERWIVFHQVIDKEPWRVLVAEFRRRYSDEVSAEGLKKFKKRALEKIYEIAK